MLFACKNLFGMPSNTARRVAVIYRRTTVSKHHYERMIPISVSHDRLIYLLFSAQQTLKTYLRQVLTSAGIAGTPAQAGILFLLKEQDGRSMSELSRALSSDNSTVTGLIDRLQKAGLVRRENSAADRRMYRIFITEQGLAEIRRLTPLIHRVNEEIKAGFTEEQMESFKAVLRSFFSKFSSGPRGN
ncbi:MAG: hypothetical protein DRH20_15540 [Deltaproteobacteria bacterium]|nr:MAG: hypothetical protein DRH20_15540 [Deltaproteobacteria bacterium]